MRNTTARSTLSIAISTALYTAIYTGMALLSVLAPLQAAESTSTTLSDSEILKHFQSLVQIQSSDPPGREQDVTDYLRQTLEAEGIEVQLFTKEENRPNLVARMRGNGSKQPLLLMAHQDTVNIDASKWTFPPFGATRDSGWIYGRGTLDDKDNLTASLMTMLALKRSGVELDRDLIFLAEAGEEGSTHLGIQYMVENHFDAIDAEFCLAEGGSVRRQQGKEYFVGVQTGEKLPKALELIAHGVSGHASIPLQSNAVESVPRHCQSGRVAAAGTTE